jgi:hypothetical protein
MTKIIIFAGPSSDEPCAVTHGRFAEGNGTSTGEPAGFDAAGRGPRPGINGRVGAEQWAAWARRQLTGTRVLWSCAEIKPVAPGSWFDATHGVEIHTAFVHRPVTSR